MRRDIAPLAVLVLAATQTAVSAQTTTVQSLMDGGYTVVSCRGERAYSCKKVCVAANTKTARGAMSRLIDQPPT